MARDSDWAHYFAGQWLLTKEISNGFSFDGEAVFSPNTDGDLLYEETGALRDDKCRMEGARARYVFRFAKDKMEMLYPESPPRLFQRFCLAGENECAADSTHLCGSDLYRSRLLITGPDQFQLIHSVKGPQKDYRIIATYSAKHRTG